MVVVVLVFESGAPLSLSLTKHRGLAFRKTSLTSLSSAYWRVTRAYIELLSVGTLVTW